MQVARSGAGNQVENRTVRLTLTGPLGKHTITKSGYGKTTGFIIDRIFSDYSNQAYNIGLKIGTEPITQQHLDELIMTTFDKDPDTGQYLDKYGNLIGPKWKQ